MTLGNSRFTAYFTRLMGVPSTLLSRMRHAAWMWAIIWLGARLTAQNDAYISADGGSRWTLAVRDFKFRQATPFTPLPANNDQLKVGIAPGNSAGPGNFLLERSLPSLAPNTYYVAAIAGTIDFSNPQADLDVDIYYFSPARNATTGSGANDVDLLLFHGSPNAGPVSYYWA